MPRLYGPRLYLESARAVSYMRRQLLGLGGEEDVTFCWFVAASLNNKTFLHEQRVLLF